MGSDAQKKMIDQIPDNASGVESPQSIPPPVPPQSAPPPVTHPPASPSAYAIAAFVLGIVSFAMCCAGIPALVLGLIEMRNIRNGISPTEGKPFALIGAILGGVSTVLMFVMGFLYLGFFLFMAFFAHGAPK